MAGRVNNKKVLINNGNTIQKSNELSMSKISQGLTLNQMQLLAYAIYATQRNEATTFIKADFEKKFGLDQYLTHKAKTDVKKLIDIKYSQEDLENDEFSYWTVFQSITYKRGTFDFEWSNKMIPHILDIKDKYIITDLTVTSNFTSSFTWVLYEFLKGKYGHWYINMSKEAVLNLFSVETKVSYQNNTALLKKYVLDVAIEEINKYTELKVGYDEIKDGRSIVGFKLSWSTGGQTKKASKKQMDILNTIVETVFKDTLMYMDIEDKTNRERAVSIVRELQQVQADYLYDDIGLTADKCTELTKKANDGLESLNYLLENEGKETLKPKVPMHDWLKDYKK